jgi:hypothetical protein
MAQHDYVIANGTGAAVRSDLNSALAAIVSQNSGATAPSTTYAYMPWADSTTGLYKIRNAANNGWITLFQLDGEWSTLAVENGSAAAPSIYFKDSGTDTGIYSPGTDQVAISTGGTGRLFVDSSGRVGLGTGSPGAKLEVYENSSSGTGIVSSLKLNSARAVGNDGSEITWNLDFPGYSSLAGIAGVFSGGGNNGHLVFKTVGSGTYAERMRIDASGRVGIGTTAADSFNSSFNNLVVGSGSGNEGIIVYTGNVDSGFLAFNDAADTSVRGLIEYNHNGDYMGLRTNGSERARIDSSGRLLVGTSSARSNFFNASSIAPLLQIEGAGSSNTDIGRFVSQAWGINGDASPVYVFAKHRSGSVGGTTVVQSSDSLGYLSFQGSDGTEFVEAASIIAQVDGTPGANDMPGRLVFSTTADGASSPTEALRINSAQQLLLNTASTINSAGFRAYVNVSGTDGGLLINNAGSSGTPMRFCTNNGTAVGSITTTASATAYSTSSDYRIKENVVLLTGAIDRLQQIPVHRFNFIADPDKTVDGFLAHEAQEVVPECVTGEKDAVDDEGNPVYQGIDQSKLVPLLTAALQEALAEIASLKDRVAALEAS